nr:MAG TPA: YopX protein [Caudoviricetes sp.]
MRELKFRAWCKSEKKMIYNIQNEFEERIELGMDCFSDYLKNDDFIVEQYTGLKDKNGKMIYEGDIVKMPDWAVEPKYKKVSFVKLSCGFEPFVNGCFECVSPDSEEVEVIGNIHENPELLEKRR